MYSKQRFGVLNHPKISIDYLVKYLDEGRGVRKEKSERRNEKSERRKEKGERRNQKEERRKKNRRSTPGGAKVKGERLKCPTGAKELSPG